MYPVREYYKTAIENEAVFRNILRDLKEMRFKRPMGMYLPEDLDTESDLRDLFDKYSSGRRQGKFTIVNFTRPENNSAVIEFQNIALLLGAGAGLMYLVNEDGSVEFQEQTFRRCCY